MEHNTPSSQDPTERMLKDIGRESTELRAETKRLHKQQLLSLAERLQKEAEHSLPVAPVSTAKQVSFWKRLRLALVGTGAGLALAACALVLFLNNGPQSGSFGSVDALGRVLVPAAQAADAFQIVADPSAARIADSSSLLLTSKVALSPDEVQRVLRVDAGRVEEVERVSDQQFRVRIAAVPADRIVRVALPAVVQNGTTTNDGTEREYSWAVQTTDELALLSSIPAQNATDVPLDTALELVLNAQGFSNVTGSVEITPTIDGRFQINGRRITFVPSKPWKANTLYQIQVKQTLSAEGLMLPEVLQLQFQTTNAYTEESNLPSLRIYTEFQEAYTGDSVSLQVSRSPGLAANSSTVAVTGYRLTEEEAVQFLQTRLPYSLSFGSDHLEHYKQAAKTEAFKADLPLFRPSERDDELVTLPKLTESGWYVIRVAQSGAEAWMFLQVTNVASYVTADKDQVLIWAVNAETKQPLSSLAVRLDGGTSLLTDSSGLARVPTPPFLTATTSLAEPGLALIRLGDATGPLRALAVIGPHSGFSLFERNARALETTWGYLYPDRPLYRTTDELFVAGLLQDRDRKQSIGNAEVRLTKPSYVEDLVNGRDRIYASATLKLDAAGRFDTYLNWKNVTPGYYQLDLLRNDELVLSRWVEIRSFVKPSYYLDVALGAKQLFAGQETQAQIKATFFNGAPVPKARLRLRLSQGETTLPDQEVVLNSQGEANVTVKTLPVACSTRLADTCRNSEPLTITLRPQEGEETEILGSAMLNVFGSELDLRGDVKMLPDRAELVFQTYHVDLAKPWDELGPIWSGRTLRGQLVGVRYEKIQDGVWYDAIEKRVVPYYRYERRQDPPVEFTVQTDVNGRASHSFAMQADRDFYEVTVQGEDANGRFTRFSTSVSRGWYTPDATSETAPRLILEGKNESQDVSLGEILKPALYLGTAPYDAAKGPGVLFLSLSRGIKQAERVSSASWQTTFNEFLLPNATLRAVTFSGNRFVQADTVVFQKKDDRELDVSITPDRTTYRPNEKMTVRFEVKAKAGQATLTDTKLAFTVVDEALLSLAQGADEEPMTWINSYVSDGVLFQRASHQGNWLYGPGGAEKGGGGMGDRGQGVRRLFKDVAATSFVPLDAQGRGVAEVVWPDNLTSWRITAVALSSDLRAGSSKQNVQVSQPVFVEAVLPDGLLVTDKPVLKLRAFGSALEAGRGLTFTLNAPAFGLTNYQATGTAGVATYVALPKLEVGSHLVQIGVVQGTFNDRVDRTLRVESSRITREEAVTFDPVPGMGLPQAVNDTVSLVVTSHGRASLYPALRALAYNGSLRADGRVAAQAARALLHTVYQEDSSESVSLLDLQVPEEGGIRLLPYGSSEVPVSAQVALTAPETVDTWQLRTYLAGKLVHAETRLERLQAMAGLAALRAPVVLDLQQAATLSDRSPEETLIIAEGLAVVGDTERAGKLIRELLQTSVKRDGERFVLIGTESSPETYEATAEAAALAERLLLPEARELAAFVQAHWSAEAFPVLAKVRYLTFRLQHVPVEEGQLSFTDGLHSETINLKDTPQRTIVLSPDQAARFRVTSVSGPISLSYIRRVSGLPAKHPTLSLVRRYEAGKPLDQLEEGDELTVSFQASFATSSLAGCAVIRDDVPANLLPLSREISEKEIPLFVESGAVSFLICKNEQFYDQSTKLSYRAKVIARGTYRAEPALLQRLDTPSVATYSTEQVLVVR